MGGGSTAQGILAGENVVGSATNLFQSAQNESATAYASSAGMSFSVMESNDVIKALFVFHLFGYLWTVEYVKAIAIMVVAGAVNQLLDLLAGQQQPSIDPLPLQLYSPQQGCLLLQYRYRSAGLGKTQSWKSCFTEFDQSPIASVAPIIGRTTATCTPRTRSDCPPPPAYPVGPPCPPSSGCADCSLTR
jgi:hypothetical protein